jgi:drug/metabolite transporter (DMT)-like permease
MMLLAGLFIFGQIPDLWAMLGAAIVIGATLYVTLREFRIAKAKPLPIVEA